MDNLPRPEWYGVLVVLCVSNNEVGDFTLGAAYAPTGAGWPNSFGRLKIFFVTPCSLVLLDDWNTILDTHQDKVGLGDRIWRCLSNFFSSLTGTDSVSRKRECGCRKAVSDLPDRI